jgi:hypothetical protein
MRYTRSGLGLVPPKESEFNYKYLPSGTSSQVASLFSSEHTIVAGSDEKNTGIFESPLTFKNLHTDERYDLSTSNIIKQLGRAGSLKLKYSDFVYCRDYGVYPNNRLIIVRRFGGPVGDSLTSRGGTPIGTLVTWFDDQNPPIAIDFGINWDEAEVSFKNVLNNIGNDIGLGKVNISLGDAASGGFNILPTPGAFEPFTRAVFARAGLVGAGSENFIPSGSPTLIKEAKQRKLIPEDSAGSSLNGKITVAVKCAWEQKFIGGIDPTKVYYDLLRMILHFGSDDASFYLGSGSTINSVLNKILAVLENPAQFIKDILTGFAKAFTKVVDQVKEKIAEYYKNTKQEEIKDRTDEDETTTAGQDAKKRREKTDLDNRNKDIKKANTNLDTLVSGVTSGLDSIIELFTTVTAGLGRKYKHVLLGIGNSLSGAPSTPWHVTVGNPFRPILSSGDMYMDSSIKLILGPTLAFNDLPSYIEVEFTLSSARNLGANEIFRKLHTGEVRISSKQKKTFYVEEEESDTVKTNSPDTGKPDSAAKDESTKTPVEPQLLNKTIVGTTNPTGTTGSNAATVNSDPNSPLPATSPGPGSTQEFVTPPINSAQQVNLQTTSPTLSAFGTTTESPFTAPPVQQFTTTPPAEGSVAQKIINETPPAPNETATQPVQEPAPQPSNWNPGEVVAQGTVYWEDNVSPFGAFDLRTGTRPSVNWKVAKAGEEGLYEGRYDLTGNGFVLAQYPDNNLQNVVKKTKDDAQRLVNTGERSPSTPSQWQIYSG